MYSVYNYGIANYQLKNNAVMFRAKTKPLCEVAEKTISKYRKYKPMELYDEYIAQLNYDGPNLSELVAEIRRRGFSEKPEAFYESIPKTNFGDYKLRHLVNTLVEQIKSNGPNIAELKAEICRRGLPEVAENPMAFYRP